MKLFSAFIALFLVQTTFALEMPSHTGFVNDFAGIISTEEEIQLEQTLVAFEKETNHEIAIVTVDSLQEVTIEEYAVELFEKWGIGKKDADNGVLLLVAPVTREVRIEVGYGLEGVLTDATSSKIIQNVIIPAFKQENYIKGIEEGTALIMSVTKGEIVDLSGKKEAKSDVGVMYFIFLYFFIYKAAVFLRKKKWPIKAGYRGVSSAIMGGMVAAQSINYFWPGFFITLGIGVFFDVVLWKFFKDKDLPLWLRGGGFFGGGRSGGGGGGFGGFGGGFSGGGGASGRW